MRLIPLSYNHQAISAPIDTVWQKMKNICNFILFKLNRFPAAEKKKTNFHPHWSNQHLLEFLFISFFSPTYFYLTTFIPSFAMNKLSAALNINNALKAQVALQSLLCKIYCKFLLLGHLCLFSSCNFFFFFLGKFFFSNSCSLQSNVRLLKTTAKGFLNADISEEAHICPLGPLSCDAEAWVDEKLACFAPDQTLTLETVALFLMMLKWHYSNRSTGLTWLWLCSPLHWDFDSDQSSAATACAGIMLIKTSPSIWHSLRLTFFLRAGVLL